MRIERKRNLNNIYENPLYLTLPMCPSDGVDVIGTDSRTPFLAPYLNVLLVCGSYMIMTTEQSSY